jgi:S-adenosylmethionine:tRNA ribosyltransferase-isomerase
MFKTADFNFNLPENLIAQEPLKNKEQTPLLVFQNNQILDKKINDLIDFFEEGSVMIFNQVKVIKAKLTGKISRNSTLIHFNLDQESNGLWNALCRPAKKVRVGDIIIISKDLSDDFFCEVVEKDNDGFVKIKFNCDEVELLAKLDKYGSVPLPPYIKRDENNQKDSQNDQKNYQTIYAQDGIAVAAPTAGLHFNENIFNKIKAKKIQCVFLTLNVGAGTFLPVRTESLEEHKMHSEKFFLSKENCEIINNAKKNGKKIIAVGTTSLRAVESSVDNNGILNPQNRATEIFIYPPYDFKIVDILMTNFHLPKSTLFMLICAFIGYENAFKLYNHAIEKQYRFYSYGDSSLLFRN